MSDLISQDICEVLKELYSLVECEKKRSASYLLTKFFNDYSSKENYRKIATFLDRLEFSKIYPESVVTTLACLRYINKEVYNSEEYLEKCVSYFYEIMPNRADEILKGLRF